MALITRDDFIDVYQKFIQRGWGFIASKFSINQQSRTKSAFSDSAFSSANWWIIPAVRARWNQKISGDANVDYERFCLNTVFNGKSALRMLSIGSGVCSHEIRFAQSGVFREVVCMDIATNLLSIAQKKAEEEQLPMTFLTADIYKTQFDAASFDVILFHSSLHHFSNIQSLIQHQIKPWLAVDGFLMMNEYVGPDRLQFKSHQIKAINQGLTLIPKHLRRRFKTNWSKNRFTGSGIWRMILADPSECVESSSIMPIIHKEFTTVLEKPYGGNLLMHILKDIAQNFVDPEDAEAMTVLSNLFELEDAYLQNHSSDFVFGVYQPKI